METVTLRASEADAGERLDAWLCAQLEELTRSAAARLCTQGQVTAGGKPLAKKLPPDRHGDRGGHFAGAGDSGRGSPGHSAGCGL